MSHRLRDATDYLNHPGGRGLLHRAAPYDKPFGAQRATRYMDYAKLCRLFPGRIDEITSCIEEPMRVTVWIRFPDHGYRGLSEETVTKSVENLNPRYEYVCWPHDTTPPTFAPEMRSVVLIASEPPHLLRMYSVAKTYNPQNIELALMGEDHHRNAEIIRGYISERADGLLPTFAPYKDPFRVVQQALANINNTIKRHRVTTERWALMEEEKARILKEREQRRKEKEIALAKERERAQLARTKARADSRADHQSRRRSSARTPEKSRTQQESSETPTTPAAPIDLETLKRQWDREAGLIAGSDYTEDRDIDADREGNSRPSLTEGSKIFSTALGNLSTATRSASSVDGTTSTAVDNTQLGSPTDSTTSSPETMQNPLDPWMAKDSEGCPVLYASNERYPQDVINKLTRSLVLYLFALKGLQPTDVSVEKSNRIKAEAFKLSRNMQIQMLMKGLRDDHRKQHNKGEEYELSESTTRLLEEKAKELVLEPSF